MTFGLAEAVSRDKDPGLEYEDTHRSEFSVSLPETAVPTATEPKATIEEYLETENARNKASAELFRDLVQAAFGDVASQVMVGHHIAFERGSDIRTMNEIPSADTLIFDHDIMTRVFGDKAVSIMMTLASFPANERDAELRRCFAARV